MRLQGQGNLLVDLYHYEKVGSHHEFGIHVANGGADGWFSFRNNGELRANGTLFAAGAAYQTDGNINGGIWGGYLSNYLNHNLCGMFAWVMWKVSLPGEAPAIRIARVMS